MITCRFCGKPVYWNAQFSEWSYTGSGVVNVCSEAPASVINSHMPYEAVIARFQAEAR